MHAWWGLVDAWSLDWYVDALVAEKLDDGGQEGVGVVVWGGLRLGELAQRRWLNMRLDLDNQNHVDVSREAVPQVVPENCQQPRRR